MSPLSPRNEGSIYSRMATQSDCRRVGGGILEMDSSDWSRIRYHIIDTRPDIEFKELKSGALKTGYNTLTALPGPTACRTPP